MNFSHSEHTFQVPLMSGGRMGRLRLSTPETSKAVYDQWMESLYLQSCMEEQTCIDLYGSKKASRGSPSSDLLPGGEAKLLGSFGREMRPQEQNVLSGVPGDVFRLYEATPSKKRPKTAQMRQADADYYIRGISYPYKKTILSLFWQETIQKVRQKL